MKKVLAIIVFCVALAVLPAAAEEMSQSGQAIGTFLKLSPDAHFSAMGNVGAAAANGISSLSYNPAGIMTAEYEAMFTHSEWLADIQYDYIALQLPIGEKSRIAINFIGVKYPDMEETTVAEPDGTGLVFSSSDTAIAITYATRLLKEIDFGFTAKAIHMAIWDMTADGFAIDMGIRYRTPIKGLTAGMSIMNFGNNPKFEGGQLDALVNQTSPEGPENQTTISQLTEDFSLPVQLKVGVAYEPYTTEQFATVVSADFINSIDNKESVRVGGEFKYIVTSAFNAAVRGGYHVDGESNASEYSFGGGVSYDFGSIGLAVDYAYNGFDNLDATHLFTLKFKF